MLHPITTRDTSVYWNDLFTDEELEQILNLCKTLPLETGTLNDGELVLDDIRKSSVGWLRRNEDTEWIFSRYDGAVQRSNSCWFGIDIDPLRVIQFTVYDDAGGHYEWHWDMNLTPEANSAEMLKQRKLSVVTQLNDPDEYDGGVLQVGPCGQIFDVEKQKGMTYMFLSFVNHRVTPVTRGTRYSLVGWYEGPDWR